jgi:hypothetical protein
MWNEGQGKVTDKLTSLVPSRAPDGTSISKSEARNILEYAINDHIALYMMPSFCTMSFTSSPDGRLQYCLGYYEEDQPPLPRILEGLPNVTTRRTVNLNKINFDSRVAPDEIKPGISVNLTQ